MQIINEITPLLDSIISESATAQPPPTLLQ